jgi:Tol biopolymer transport system component
MRIGTLVAAALAAAGLLLLSGCGGDGEPRPDLVFVSTRDGDYALYGMNADGGRQKRLSDEEPDTETTQGVYFQLDPAFSPDARRIAYAGRRGGSFDIYVMSVDGGRTRRLTTSGADQQSPTFSPDGKQIAFASVQPADLWVMAADGTKARRLRGEPAEETEPAWSPDGRWIAFVRRTPGTDIREIWVVRPDGSGRRRVTSLGAGSYSPAWSPDSSRLAFASNARSSRLEVYVIGLDGRGLQRVTFSGDDAFDPAFARDGRSLAFSRDGAIVVAELPSGRAEELTDGDNNDSSPVWNPRPPPADRD